MQKILFTENFMDSVSPKRFFVFAGAVITVQLRPVMPSCYRRMHAAKENTAK